MRIFFLFCLMLCFSCEWDEEGDKQDGTASSKDSVMTGGVRLITLESGQQVWTKKVGSGKVKMLLLHDGPGFSHDYLQCFEDFMLPAGIEIYFYDQLGCGNSEKPADLNQYTLDNYREEVEQVRKALGLDHFYLFGHGWGGMLALEYMTSYQEKIKGLVLSNTTAGIRQYQAYATTIRNRVLSEEERVLFDSLNRNRAWNGTDGQTKLFLKYYNQAICRVSPWPAPFQVTWRKQNTDLYRKMMGLDEFHLNGQLQSWDRWDTLSYMAAPTLILAGKHDEINPDDSREMAKKMPNARSFICPAGSHFSMYDNQAVYFGEILRFIEDVEADAFNLDSAPDS